MAKQTPERKEPTLGKSPIPDSGKVEVGSKIEVVAAEGDKPVTEATKAPPTLEEQLAEMRQKLEAAEKDKAAERARAEAAERVAAENAGKAETNEQAALRNHETAVKQAQEANKGALVEAKRAYAQAMEQGDFNKAAEAQEAIATLAQQKTALETEVGRIGQYKEAIKNRPAATSRPANAVGVDVSTMPREAQDWLGQHHEFLGDARKWQKLSAAHTDALAEGLTAYSRDYFDHVEKFVGVKRDDAIQADQTPRGTAAMPPSRGAAPQPAQPTGATRVALTARERDAAHHSWPELSANEAEVRYAENKLALMNEGRLGRPN